jgi:WhiB family transcriptional regulator, redox-sensing transcriptional regulator
MRIPTPPPGRRTVHPSKRSALVRRIEVGWQDQALCRKFPADDWFPARSDSPIVAELVEVCRRCPAQRSCLAAALVVPEEHGIWGGTTEADRVYGLSALARGASVPEVLDELQTTSHETSDDDRKRGEAA